MSSQDNNQVFSKWFEELSVSTIFAETANSPSESSPASPSPAGAGNSSVASNGSENNASLTSQQTLLMTIAREAMACEFEVLLNQHQYPQAADRAIAALDLVQHYESELSVYRPRSDLSTLNKFGGSKSVALSGETIRLLQLAIDVFEQTSHAFDITAGSLSEAWGFSRREGRRPSEEEIGVALEKVGTDLLTVDPETSTARFLREGVSVNPGGIGKGFAIDRAAQLLARNGIHDFMMHGGLSSVIAHGDRLHPDTGGGWLVALKHPWRWEQKLGMIRLRDQALSTSGSGKQFFHFDGQRYSHIIDPRTGWPAQQMMSATVICRSAAISDALATAFFVMGEQAATEFCDRNPEISAVLVYQDEKTRKQVLKTINLADDQWIDERS